MSPLWLSGTHQTCLSGAKKVQENGIWQRKMFNLCRSHPSSKVSGGKWKVTSNPLIQIYMGSIREHPSLLFQRQFASNSGYKVFNADYYQASNVFKGAMAEKDSMTAHVCHGTKGAKLALLMVTDEGPSLLG